MPCSKPPATRPQSDQLLDDKPRRLKGKHPSAEEAIAATEAAIAEGQKSMKWWPPGR